MRNYNLRYNIILMRNKQNSFKYRVFLVFIDNKNYNKNIIVEEVVSNMVRCKIKCNRTIC